MAQAVFSQAFPLRSPYLQNCMEGRQQYEEGTSQDWLAGAPIKLDGSNGVVLATASSNQIPDLGILGFAAADATGVAGTAVQMRIPLEEELWVMNYKPSGGGSQATSEALRGDRVNFDIHTDGDNEYLVANTTSADADKPSGVIRELYTQAAGYVNAPDADGDLNGRVVVAIKKAYWQ